jgi:hypothetical protein
VLRDELRAAGEALAVAGPSLTHLTMNTGHLVYSPRDQVAPETIRLLAPMVAAGRGEAASIPFAIGRRDEGAALFRLGEPRTVVCGVCWRENRAPATWGALLAAVDIQGVRMPPAERPPVPWLAVVLIAAMPPETALRFADLEQSIAWVLIEQATAS